MIIWKKNLYEIGFIFTNRYVLIEGNLTSAIPIDSAKKRMTNTATSDATSDKTIDAHGKVMANNRTLEYFKKVKKKELVRDLLELFAPDFQLFQYSTLGFLI